MDDTWMTRIDALNDEYITEEDSPEAPPLGNQIVQDEVQVTTPWLPIDLYRNTQRKIIANSKKEFPKGSRALVMAATERLINGREGLAYARKRAEDDSESLKANGYKDRAELRKVQYMEERFLPAVESVVDSTSPDEVLNCREALAAFDKMALGVGAMSGYTAAYIRQAYGDQLGMKRGGSDPTVSAEMARIKSLVANDQIRTAIGAASKLKKQIDNGEHMAEPEDYAVLGRIVAYAN
jgi:hypothetical protein